MQGLREQKVLRTRRALVETAWRLFRERGYDRTTVGEITDEVGVSRRTFFRYFPSKEAVLFEPDRDLVPRFVAALHARSAGSTPIEALAGALGALGDAYAANEDFYLLRTRLARSDPKVARYQLELFRERETELAEVLGDVLGIDPSADMRPALLAAVAMSVIRVATERWLASDGVRPMDELVREAFAALDAVAPVLGLSRSA